MTGELLSWIAAVAACVGGLLTLASRRDYRLAGLIMLLASWVGMLVALAGSALLDHAWLVLVALIAACAVAWLLAGACVGRERWLLMAGALVLSLRIPIPTAGETSMLLGPLYAVIGFGTVVLIRREVCAWRSGWRELARQRNQRGGATSLLDIAAASLPTLAAISLAWSIDAEASIRVLASFLIPFFITYLLVREWVHTERDVVPSAVAVVGTAFVAAVVGIYQWSVHVVWWNPKVIDANRFRADFRTNSVFWDPNIYGRVLIVALLVLIAWRIAGARSRIQSLGALVVGATLVVALWATYSQSSWFALGAALLILGLLTLPRRARRWAGAIVLVAAVVAIPVSYQALAGPDVDGRADVVQTGIDLATERPIAGWGIGTFEVAATRSLEASDESIDQLTASHTTPITVITELGIVGLIAYIALLTLATASALVRWRRASRDPRQQPTGWPLASVIWATATLIALFSHSLLYAGFFEDATLWVALAVLASLPPVSSDPRDS